VKKSRFPVSSLSKRLENKNVLETIRVKYAARLLNSGKVPSSAIQLFVLTPFTITFTMTVTEMKTQQWLANGETKSTQKPDADDRAVLALRNFIFDICNQNGGGHGGSAIGMAAIGVALYKYVMRYNPSNPEWFDRDRFVLSNGMCLCPV
jgi:hypothetical protein